MQNLVKKPWNQAFPVVVHALLDFFEKPVD